MLPETLEKTLSKLYQSTNGFTLSITDRKRLTISDVSFTYGEITPKAFLSILNLIEPNEDKIFYDLGSGIGKAVFCAALLFRWKKCRGIELLPSLFQKSQHLLEKFHHLPEVKKFYRDQAIPIDFIEGDILSIDFSEADVVFVNGTTFQPALWDRLINKFHLLKAGTYIIVNTKIIRDEHFEIMHVDDYLMSWGKCRVVVYQKV